MRDTTLAGSFLSWLQASPSPWHASQEAVKRLRAHKFVLLEESDKNWLLVPGLKYVVQRGAAVLAWRQPTRLERMTIGLAHTDSPGLRLRPQGGGVTCGCQRWSVEPYGGLLHHSWLDRELEVAGRVVVLNDAQEPEERLVRLDDPRPIIPSLAIHLDRGVNERGLILDRQRHLQPLVGLDNGKKSDVRHVLADHLDLRPAQVLAWDLCLNDATPPALVGNHGELVLSGRLDNLSSCHALLEALLTLPERADSTHLPLLAFMDGEEVGSTSAEGADGGFLPRVVERISLASGLSRSSHLSMLSRSFALSCDMAHAVHPNYPERHDLENAPVLGGGPVAKWNAGLRYATTASSLARLKMAAARAHVPLQTFAMRADLACGSTVGPIVSAWLGMETVDCGAPMLAMHSARESMALADHFSSVGLYREVLAGD